MPNVKGGKGYKRGKHSTTEEKMIEWNEAEGQMIGRVIGVLGSRRFNVYCNDNKTRICRLCGSMNKSDWINKGAIVLIAQRSLSTSTTGNNGKDIGGNNGKDIGGNNGKDIGDVTHVFDTFFYKDLKAMPTTNPVLFTQVEEKNIEDVMKRVKEDNVDVDDDDFFLQEGEEEGDAAAETNAKEASEKELKEAARKESEKERALTMRTRRQEKEVTFDEL
jgi:initiation factor 1A